MLFGSYYVTVMEWSSWTDPSLVTFVSWQVPSDFLRCDGTTHRSQQSSLFTPGCKFPISWGVHACSQASSGPSILLVPPCPLMDLRTQLGLLHVHWGCKKPRALPQFRHLIDHGLILLHCLHECLFPEDLGPTSHNVNWPAAVKLFELLHTYLYVLKSASSQSPNISLLVW